MLFAFLICVLVFSAVVTPTLTHTKKTKVIILGAGISGAGASSALTSAGITDFIVLEAQSVIGGRIKQGQISGVNVEVGANWVEGIGGAQVNPIWTFAQQLNLTMTNTDFGDAIVLSEDGVRENETVMSEFLEKLEQAESLVKERERKGLEDISVRTALHLEGWRATTPTHDLAECMMIEQQFAGNVDLLSASYTLHEGTFQDFGEETRFIIDSRGYKSIPEFVFREANATEKIVFGTTVIEISYNEEGVVVKTSNGDIYEGDYLISTVSLGVYQAEQIKLG